MEYKLIILVLCKAWNKIIYIMNKFFMILFSVRERERDEGKQTRTL